MAVPRVPADTAEGFDVTFQDMPYLFAALEGLTPVDQSFAGGYITALSKYLGPAVAGGVQTAVIDAGGE